MAFLFLSQPNTFFFVFLVVFLVSHRFCLVPANECDKRKGEKVRKQINDKIFFCFLHLNWNKKFFSDRMFCVLLDCTNIEYNEQAIAMHVLLLIWSHSFFPFSFYYYFSHRFIVSLKSSFSFLSFIRFHLLSYYFISRFNFSYSSANIHFVYIFI